MITWKVIYSASIGTKGIIEIKKIELFTHGPLTRQYFYLGNVLLRERPEGVPEVDTVGLQRK